MGFSAMPKDLRIRNRAVIMLLLPIVVIIWMAGWIMYWKGSQGKPHRTITTAAKGDGVEIGVVLFEENAQYSD